MSTSCSLFHQKCFPLLPPQMVSCKKALSKGVNFTTRAKTRKKVLKENGNVCRTLLFSDLCCDPERVGLTGLIYQTVYKVVQLDTPHPLMHQLQFNNTSYTDHFPHNEYCYFWYFKYILLIILDLGKILNAVFLLLNFKTFLYWHLYLGKSSEYISQHWSQYIMFGVLTYGRCGTSKTLCYSTWESII